MQEVISMARWDYRCDDCEAFYEDVWQEIGSEPEPACPEGHSWERLFNAASVKIDGTFKGYASISPQMETFWATGDPELAFGNGGKDRAPDAFTLEDLHDDQIANNTW